MPRRSSSAKAPEQATWGKAAPVLVVAGIFDVLRLFFEQFWFFGPLLSGATAAAYVNSKIGFGGAAVGKVVAFFTGITGAAAFEVFGLVMAMAVGFTGWMIIGLYLLIKNPRIFSTGATSKLWFLFGLFVSELPVLGSIPMLTISLSRMYRTQIRKDKRAMQKYRAQEAQRETEQRQARAQGLMQAQAANDNREIPQEEAEAA